MTLLHLLVAGCALTGAATWHRTRPRPAPISRRTMRRYQEKEGAE